MVALRIGEVLAWRAAEVRWGVDAADEFEIHIDPDIRGAMTYWTRLSGLLSGPGR
jgi:hypothetical protein